MREYCLLDTRFQKIAIFLKQWNKSLAKDKNARLNSFSIYLMLLAYMQDQGWLPCL